MISVCIATFNGGDTIERQLLSILKQLDENDEVIISDDHSSDNTCNIVSCLNDKRIRLFKNKGSRGPVGNFQNALYNSKGDYIFLSDQDDIWLDDKVVTMVSALRSCDLVLSDCHVVNKNLNFISKSFFKLRNSRPGFVHNVYKNSYIGCCMAFRRNVLSYVLPIPNSIHMHDWWIGLMVETNGNVTFIDKPLLLYVRHGNNASPTGEKSHNNVITRLRNRAQLFFHVMVRNISRSINYP